ncbi:MAG: CDP-diacylglycerol--glycerol-3-phosphate 3-phosphatidyltransferase [Pelotomaculum sp.]|uniref:CDP-diacylglycerol--glycerol-3-phosphate 3-phosphatidyltransferase n=1 Tax=Pelotomaculum thermopropionicum (strain DSM 13744 / JCM 10971 / SI) TaxID=370438 RepID=A5D2R4_PELTS|nr:CDP-diacylglycerol--glycerol-3-phosphate 3-phosphatidyltransferase [Pelotomaculum sp.]BAF59478.1 phosphatidylglycerophosphate synthase [Pelotomaculum thermopropionicum SI]
MNLPNKLTLARFLMIPVFLVIVSTGWRYNNYLAAAVFLLGAVTDGLDGYIARKRGQVTLAGKLMDPLADKVLVAAALIALVELERLPGWIAVVIISREFAVTGLRATAAAGGVIVPASRLGKFKMIAQAIAIVALFVNSLPFSFERPAFSTIAVAAALVLTVWSGFDYFLKTWQQLVAEKK